MKNDATDDTPRQGQDSTDIDNLDWPPMLDATDHEIAMALEDAKQETRKAVNDVNPSLVDDSEPLTDAKLQRLAEVGNALSALSDTLAHRVPEEHRVGPDAEPPFYED